MQNTKKNCTLNIQLQIKHTIGLSMSLSLFTPKNFARLITLSLISINIQAAKPMTEDDLGSVSAEAGDNILNLLGAPAAGLTIDHADTNSDGNTAASSSEQYDTYNEGETTKDFAIEEIKSLENVSINQPNAFPDHDVDISAFEEAIYASKQTIRIATSLDFSNSEIRYLDKDMHHNLTVISENNINISRDLQIDLLKVDKLNTSEDGPSAGSIYLSDWRSQGTTRIRSKN